MTYSRLRDVALAILACSLILCVVAIFNGYPLVFPDTGVYLSQALEFRGDSSRPPYYSLFLLPIHMGTSLWPVVFVQAAIMAGVLHLSICTAFNKKASPRFLLVVTCLLAIFSSLPWHTGQILPDIFASVLILSIYVLVFGWDDLDPMPRYFIVIVLFLSTAFHYSHLPLLGVTGGTALLLAVWKRGTTRGLWISASFILVSCIIAAAAFATYNYAYSGRASISLDGSKFLLARLIGDGTAVEYLRYSCPKNGFVLCDHLDEIKGDHNTFLWNENSPWRHVENMRGFLGARDEAAAIIRGTLLNFPLEQATKSIKNLATQFVSFGTGDTSCPCIGESRVNQVISKYFPAEHDSFLMSKQNTDILPIGVIRDIHSIAVVGSVLGCIAFILGFFPRKHSSFEVESRISSLLVIVVTGISANAIITGVLSGPADRYQSRLIWLVVFVFLLISLPFFMKTDRRLDATLNQ